MTTSVTVETHDWPVDVTITDTDCARGRRKSVTVETVPPNSERVFHLTDSRSICFDELEAPPATAESHPIPPTDPE